MRKLKLLTGGRPRVLDDYQVLQDLTEKSTQAPFKGRGGFILEGCEVSGNDIAAGVVFLDGELMELPATVGHTFPVYIAAAAVVDDVTDLYDDGGTKATQTETAAQVLTSIPGSGEYITMSATGGRTWYDAQADEFVRMKGSQTIGGIKTFTEKVFSAGVDLVAQISSLGTNKVDKISGKGLSTEDFTTAFKTKLTDLYTKAGIDALFSTVYNSMNTLLSLKVNISDVTNNLISNSASAPLSAAQGKALNDKIANLRTAVFEIGDWNMDADEYKTVINNIPGLATKLRSLSVMVRNDPSGANFVRNLEHSGEAYFVIATANGQFSLRRETGGVYDGISFDSTGYNRGWITIQYEDS